MGNSSTPEKLDLNVALPENTPKDTEAQLTALRESIQADLASGTKLRRVATYCQTNGIDCESWNDKGPLTGPQLNQITTVFNGVPAIHEKLIPLLSSKDDTQRDWARKTLTKITELIKTQLNELKGFKKESTELKQDVCGEYLGSVGDRAKETMKNHPWATILSAGVAAYTAYLLYTHDVHSKWAKPLVQGGVLLGVGNFLSKLFIPNGKTAFQNLAAWVQGTPNLGTKVSSFVDGFKGKGVDTNVLQTSLQMGSIKFDAFLDAYKSASNGKIDMAALQRKAAGLGISSDLFNESNGEGLYKVMKQLCEKVGQGNPGVGLEFLERNYGTDGKYEDFTFTDVAFVEGFDPAGIAVTGEVAEAKAEKTGKGAETKAGVAGAVASVEKELYEVPGFEGMGLELKSATKTAIVDGYSFPYARTVESNGSVHYKITDPSVMKFGEPGKEKSFGPRSFDFEVGTGANLEGSKIMLTDMQRYLCLKTAYLLQKNDLIVDSTALVYEAGSWVVLYPSGLDYSLGGGSNPKLKLEAKPTPTNELKISCNGKETSGKEFTQNLQKEALVLMLIETPTSPLYRYAPNQIQITSVDPKNTYPRMIEGTSDGTPFKCYYDVSTKTYVFTELPPLNETSINKKTENVENLTEFNALFDGLQAAGDKLSPWLRGASDIFMSWTWADGEWPDSANDQWHAFVSFKKGEILDLYRAELKKVDSSAPDASEQIKKVYDSTLGDFLNEFKNLPSQLDAAHATDDEATAQQLVEKFRTFGYSNAYNKVRDDFVQKIEKINFPGFNEKSNPDQQRCVFFLQQQYTRLTATLIRENFEPVKGDARYDYNEYVQREMLAIVGRARKNPTKVDGVLSDLWENFIRDGVSWNELQAAKPEFDKIFTFDRWQTEEHRSPDLEALMQAARPELKGHENMYSLKPVPGNDWQFEITWYPGKSYAFTALVEIDPVTQIMEYRSLQLSEQWINDHVESIRTCPEFSDCFKDLSNQFNAAGAKITPFNLLPGVAGLFSDIEEGSWKSLVTYKQEEILMDYKRQLMEILYSKKSKTDQAREMDALHINFANRYLRDAKAMNDRLAKRVKECTQDSTKEITEGEFRNIYSGLERMGYTPDYFSLMRDARAYYEKFNYNGWDHPSVGVNAVMKLLYSKTAFMNEPGRHLEPEERAYFVAVQDKVDSIVLQAHANTKGTGSWFQSAIGHDEVPASIDFPDYSDWLKSNPDAGKPVITLPTGKSFEVEQNRLSDEFKAIYETEYAKKVYPQYPTKEPLSDDYDSKVVKEQEMGQEQVTSAAILKALKDPATEETAKKDYTEYWKKRLEEAKDGWWIF